MAVIDGELIFLVAGRKYHDIPVSTSNNNGPNSSFAELPDATCENTAPVMAKKKPA